MLRDIVGFWNEIFTRDRLIVFLSIILIVLVGVVLLRIVSGLVGRVLKRRVNAQTAMVIRKIIFYSGTVILILIVLQQVGVKLGALMGAAGVVGIAVGFAAQKSLSNLISGIFLIWEKPFRVGDFIRIGNDSGIVRSVDLLSVKVRTHGNLFVRIPNSRIIDEVMTNITYFPIRRMEIDINVAYKEDPGRVMTVLREIARANPDILDEPEPLILMQEMAESSLKFLFAVWFQKSDFIKVRNSVLPAIITRFREEDIEIPFPHRSLYTGSATAPFPIRIVGGDGTDSTSLAGVKDSANDTRDGDYPTQGNPETRK